MSFYDNQDWSSLRFNFLRMRADPMPGAGSMRQTGYARCLDHSRLDSALVLVHPIAVAGGTY